MHWVLYGAHEWQIPVDRLRALRSFHFNYVCYYLGRRTTWVARPARHSEVVMSRTLRYILIAVGVLIVLLIIVPFFIPVNQFKSTIEEKASAALGRKVQLGKLSLSLFHGALTAQDLSVGDDAKFSPSPFLTAKSLSVGVEMMPLIFSKQLNVTDIIIDEPQVTLLKNPAGDWNYSTMGGSSSAAPAAKPAAAATKAESLQPARLPIFP